MGHAGRSRGVCVDRAPCPERPGSPGAVPGSPDSLSVPTGNSQARDATKVGTIIYAVGSSGRDAALWTWDGANPVVRTVLPNAPSYVSGLSGVTAGAITRDATYIASQARAGDNSSGTAGGDAVQVRTSDRFTVVLNVSSYTPFTKPTDARAISDDGSILYGSVNNGLGGVRAARFDTVLGTSTLIPLLGATTRNAPLKP